MPARKFSFLWFLSLVCLFPQTLSAQKFNETGHLLNVINFQPRETRSHPQNWEITQDHRGILYFGNNDGLLEFDGLNWDKININDQVVRSLDVDIMGRVYIGLYSPGGYGYLSVNEKGLFEYKSLSETLDSVFHDTGPIEMVKTTTEGVFFQSNYYIFFWNGDSTKIWESETIFHTAHYIKDELFTREADIGLKVLKDGEFKLIPGGEKFANIAIADMINYEDDILIFTETDGIFIMKISAQNNQIEYYRHFNDLDNFLFENQINCAIRISDDKFAIGTQGKGVVIYDQKTDVFNFINFTSGLQAEAVNDMFLDQQNNLWLSLNKGLSVIHPVSPLTFFGYNSGIKETVEGICRHNNTLFIGTHLGVKYLSIYQKEKSLPQSVYNQLYNIPAFRSIENLEEQCYALTNFISESEEILLIVSYNGIYELTSDFKANLIHECAPWNVFQSKSNPKRIIVANENGIESLYRHDGKWHYEGPVSDEEDDCREIAEDRSGNIWVGDNNQGKLYKINFSKGNFPQTPVFQIYDTLSGLPAGAIVPAIVNNELRIGTSEGIYFLDENENIFKPDPVFFNAFNNQITDIHRVSQDSSGKIWCAIYLNDEGYYQLGYLEENDSAFEWIQAPFNSFSKGVIHSIYHQPNNISWLGGPDGLFRYDFSIHKNYKVTYPALIRKVRLNDDSLLFKGNFIDEYNNIICDQLQGSNPEIKFRFNNISFEFSAQLNEDESPVMFSHYLKGFESGWSSWSTESLKGYTNLKEKKYIFYVKAKNMYDHESTVCEYNFTILPPWYRTIPAIILFVILIVGFVYLIVKFYTKNLRRIIKERTSEIREQKEEIEIKSKDILDSILYAQKIQTALLPPGDYLDEFIPERFILYKPRDIVSGDFYWITQKNEKVITVTADCTGHGVPGAMMSMLGMAFLNEIITKTEDLDPGEILMLLRKQIVQSLRQTGRSGENQDGMDLALCIYDFKNMILEYSGANIPLYLFRNKELTQIKPDKMPIGIGMKMNKSFKSHHIPLEKNDVIYTFSDGYPDQFGGENNKKFMVKKLRLMLSEIHQYPMIKQMKYLENTIQSWMKDTHQIDDILVMGIKV